MGMGTYFRGASEHLLFGVRGSLPLKRKDAITYFLAKRGSGGHSSKPAEILEFIESCSPGPYIELFARSKREGWTAWGADAK
jgi:N6-adenosine-specific RNA methylase IME4